MAAKRRGNGEGSIGIDARGRWCARVSLPNGQRKALYGKTRGEVAEKLRTHDRTPLAGTAKLGEVIDRALVLAVGRLEATGGNPSTLNHRRAMLAHFTDLRRRPLGALRAVEVTAALEAMAAAGYSRSTIERARIELGRVIEWARNDGLVTRNVAKNADLPAGIKTTRRARRSLEVDELARLRAAARDTRLEHALEVAVGLCLRPGELAALRWCDVDFDAARVRIEHSLADDGRTLGPPKTPESRKALAASPSVMAALEAQRSAQVRHRERRLATGEPWTNLDLVFPTRGGTPMDHRNFAAQLAVICRSAAVSPAIAPNELRHTGASLLLDQGATRTAVARFLRHTSTRMLDRHYGHELGPAVDIAAADVLASIPAVALMTV